jgi:zeaxanthin glucosyltransferase
MSHFAVLCPPTSGHLYPLSTLGRALQARGHRVTVFQLPVLRARIEREGLEFLPLGVNPGEAGELATAIEQLSRLTGLHAIRFTIQCATKLAALVLRDAPAALRAAGVDMALIDQNEPAGASVAEHLGIPFVSIAHLPLNREPSMPPAFVPWAYRDDFAGRIRNQLGYAVADFMTTPLLSVLNKQRRTWGLPAYRTPDDSFSRLAQICTLPAALDYPRTSLPACFHYAGPFTDEARANVSFPWEQLDGRPLVYASFGTLQNGRPEQFQAVAAACEGLGVQLVMSAGGGDLSAQEWPGAPIVVRYAPQLQLLRKCRVFITHAGLNSVLEALQEGVPMVAVPVTNDQPAVAARLHWSGTGEVVPVNRLSPDRLRVAIERVLKNDSYRQNAFRLQREIGQAGGVQRAADIVETLLPSRSQTGSGPRPQRSVAL